MPPRRKPKTLAPPEIKARRWLKQTATMGSMQIKTWIPQGEASAVLQQAKQGGAVGTAGAYNKAAPITRSTRRSHKESLGVVLDSDFAAAVAPSVATGELRPTKRPRATAAMEAGNKMTGL